MTVAKKRNVKEAGKYMRLAMGAMGLDLSDENFKETPERFIKYLEEFLQPFDSEEVVRAGFSAVEHEYKGIVVQSNIPFRTICPHHLLPVVGRAHIGYVPGDRVVGLSKLTRLIQVIGREKPRMQEDITDIAVDILMTKLKARGAIVVTAAQHMCMAGRGVKVDQVPTTTSSVRGVFRDVQAAREEFFSLVNIGSKIAL